MVIHTSRCGRSHVCLCSTYKDWSRTDISYLSACISSILRTYYTWKIAGSADISYNMVPVGLWATAELATGFIISCLPVIPKFFQHMWPKVSRALSVLSNFRKDSKIVSTPSVPVEEPPWSLKLKLPSFKHTFASVFSYTEKEDVQELHDYLTQPKRHYAILPEQTAVPRREAAMELSQMPAARLATRRDDLERRISGIQFAETMRLA